MPGANLLPMSAYPVRGRHRLVLAALLVAVAAPAFAEEQVIALNPEAKEKLLNDAATRNQSRPATGEPVINGLGGLGGLRNVHGEVGMFVGTGGSRGIYGSAVAPIGENGQVAIAVENSRFGR